MRAEIAKFLLIKRNRLNADYVPKESLQKLVYKST
jgi:hypothetical protein